MNNLFYSHSTAVHAIMRMLHLTRWDRVWWLHSGFFFMVFFLHLWMEYCTRLQVWLHAKWQCSQVLEGRNQFVKEPQWFTLLNQVDTIRCLSSRPLLHLVSNPLLRAQREWNLGHGQPCTCEGTENARRVFHKCRPLISCKQMKIFTPKGCRGDCNRQWKHRP